MASSDKIGTTVVLIIVGFFVFWLCLAGAVILSGYLGYSAFSGWRAGCSLNVSCRETMPKWLVLRPALPDQSN